MALLTSTGDYWDVSSNPSNIQGLEITGDKAFGNSILNLFRTPYDDRSATFTMGFGNRLRKLLHEPITSITAGHIHSYVVDTVQTGHQLAVLNLGATTVTPLKTGARPGYAVVVVVAQQHTLAWSTLRFNLIK